MSAETKSLDLPTEYDEEIDAIDVLYRFALKCKELKSLASDSCERTVYEQADYDRLKALSDWANMHIEDFAGNAMDQIHQTLQLTRPKGSRLDDYLAKFRQRATELDEAYKEFHDYRDVVRLLKDRHYADIIFPIDAEDRKDADVDVIPVNQSDVRILRDDEDFYMEREGAIRIAMTAFGIHLKEYAQEGEGWLINNPVALEQLINDTAMRSLFIQVLKSFKHTQYYADTEAVRNIVLDYVRKRELHMPSEDLAAIVKI